MNELANQIINLCSFLEPYSKYGKFYLPISTGVIILTKYDSSIIFEHTYELPSNPAFIYRLEIRKEKGIHITNTNVLNNELVIVSESDLLIVLRSILEEIKKYIFGAINRDAILTRKK